MRRFLIATALLITLGMSAQIQMRQAFKTMPDALVPYLTENNRLDLIDFIDSNMKAEVRNALEGKSELLVLTEKYLSMSLTDVSHLEMLLLDTNEAVDSVCQIICVVRTFKTTIRESVVEFYSTQWRKLCTADYITLPQELFTAKLGEEGEMLVIQPGNELDKPAFEDQKEIEKPLIVVNFDGKIFK